MRKNVQLILVVLLALVPAPSWPGRGPDPYARIRPRIQAGRRHKLATYDQADRLFQGSWPRPARRLKLMEAGQDDPGPDRYFRPDLEPREPGRDRPPARDRPAPGPSRGPDRRRSPQRWPAKARPSSISTAAATRPRWPAPQMTPQLAYDLLSRARRIPRSGRSSTTSSSSSGRP